MEFKGHHFAELAERWGIIPPTPEEDDSEFYLEKIKELLEPVSFWESLVRGDAEALSKVQDMRDFLNALAVEAEKTNYEGPIWRGLLQVEEPVTFCQFFLTLLPHMWT